ncbi:uncharacterized protein LOC110021495 [Phalaenopsis equestris]|uniref:uncharacterized protein LOC110021495 n=1 Tax=Phalaenopsis equestris TaxID=78828 RepID=UPI0009E3799E|nr:uncharacterized protein LOC110021495 [Phalaenopsis equestris]
MSNSISYILVFLINSLLFPFRFIASHVLSKIGLVREDDFSVSELNEPISVNKVEEKDGSFCLKFLYQICNDYKDSPVKAMEENESLLTSSDVRKYQFWAEKDFNGAMEESKAPNFHVQESFMEYYNFDGDSFLSAVQFQKKQFSDEENFDYVCSEISSVGEREFGLEFSALDSYTESSSEEGHTVSDLTIDSNLFSPFSDGYFGDSENDEGIRETSVNNRNKLAEEKHELFLKRSEGEEENDDDRQVGKQKHVVNAEKNINKKTCLNETTAKVEIQSNKREARQMHVQFEEQIKNKEASFIKKGNASLDISGGAFSEPKPETSNRDEVRNIEEDVSNNDSSNSIDVSYEQQHTIDNQDTGRQKPALEEEKGIETIILDLDDDEFNEIWKHQDLILQLQMELKKVRAIGLPTILEESESPRANEDSKSFKIDEKLFHEGPVDDELHKLYRCYREGMRKLDILNYQKIYATGFLQQKDPLKSNKTQKPMLSTIMSHLSQSFLPFSKKKSNCDTSEKYIKELRCDLETVYVGQICLSWEFLRWQYEKLHKLTYSDPFISHQYNKVAAEFQQFIVTLQRFVENEMFQGPRLANYVKQRCLLRNLLQLPVFKEDSLKDKLEKGKEEDVINSEMLEDIMQEAMGVFGEFVKAEKYETTRFLKGLFENHVELQVPSDYELMVDIQACLKNKKKKLKNLMNASNCIVKMLKRRQEGRSNQDLFFTEVDLQIVSRVLKMSRITSDQLIWCQKKLNKITFSGKKVHRESSFLQFPC